MPSMTRLVAVSVRFRLCSSLTAASALSSKMDLRTHRLAIVACLWWCQAVITWKRCVFPGCGLHLCAGAAASPSQPRRVRRTAGPGDYTILVVVKVTPGPRPCESRPGCPDRAAGRRNGLLPRVAVIEELVEQLAVDRDLDVGNHAPAILLGHGLDLIGEPGVGRNELVVDMNERVKRPRPDRVAVGAVDLGLVALAEVAVGRRAAEVHAGVAAVIDLQLGPQAEVLVGLGAVQHRGLAGADDGAVLDLPVAVLTTALGPAAQGCAVEERDPFAAAGARAVRGQGRQGQNHETSAGSWNAFHGG